MLRLIALEQHDERDDQHDGRQDGQGDLDPAIGPLALDFAGDGIRANCVCPGFMERVMTDRRRELTEEQQEARAASAVSPRCN